MPITDTFNDTRTIFTKPLTTGDGLIDIVVRSQFGYSAGPHVFQEYRDGSYVGRFYYRVWDIFEQNGVSDLVIEPLNQKLFFSQGRLHELYLHFYWNSLEDLGPIKRFPLPL